MGNLDTHYFGGNSNKLLPVSEFDIIYLNDFQNGIFFEEISSINISTLSNNGAHFLCKSKHNDIIHHRHLHRKWMYESIFTSWGNFFDWKEYVLDRGVLYNRGVLAGLEIDYDLDFPLDSQPQNALSNVAWSTVVSGQGDLHSVQDELFSICEKLAFKNGLG